MNTQLPADLEQFVQAEVRRGRFTSSDEAITAAVRLFRKPEEAEQARALEDIRQGIEEMGAGRTQPLAEASPTSSPSTRMPSTSCMSVARPARNWNPDVALPIRLSPRLDANLSERPRLEFKRGLAYRNRP